MLLLASTLLLLGAPPAFEAPRAEIRVVRRAGAEDCADAEALVQRVGSIAGSGVATATGSAPMQIDVVITHESDHYEATLNVFGEQRGFRRLSDPGSHCAGLGEALAVTIALLLDPHATEPRSEPAAPASAAPSPASATPVSSSPPPATRPLHLRLELNAGIAIGLLDRPVAQAGLGAGLAAGRFELVLGGRVQQADRVADDRGYADLSLWFAYLRACVTIAGRREALGLDLCAGPVLGRLSASGHGFDRDLEEQLPWLGGALGGRVEGLIAPRISWQLSLSAVAPLARRSLSVLDAGKPREIFHTQNLGATAELGVVVTL